ncbi:MAG: hypothetical protein LKE81_07145 [Acetobacter sp.]|jgi:hypothetical protein|nr:hypothetical protein [Acetobacter sp.]MCH4061186.1 hypothetical protein [Acetobacter sp.]MCH4088123.1 hypothetical protein [Acetobacter sp.]
MEFLRIFESQNYVVDYFSQKQTRKNIVVTFTERSNRKIDGTGFGGNFLLSNRFSVISIKSNVDNWYQDIPEELLRATRDFLNEKSFLDFNKSSYGSSMGAYAAIAFSSILNIDHIFAISPLVNISFDWDQRWAADFKRLGTFKQIDRYMIKSNTRITVAYDPYDLDHKHAELISQLASPGLYFPVRAPFSGHPSGQVLSKAGVLKTLASAALSGAELPPIQKILRANRQNNSSYLTVLAKNCHRANKKTWSRDLYLKAVKTAPYNAEFQVQAARAYEQTVELDLAIMHGATAVALAPRNPYIAATLARILDKAGLAQQAAYQLRYALQCDAQNEGFLLHKASLERRYPNLVSLFRDSERGEGLYGVSSVKP